MEELIKLISEADDFYSLHAADYQQIEEAERSLGLCFSDDYKEYVLAFGAATFGGHELTGICKSDRLSVVSATNRARMYYPQFPTNYYVAEEMQFDHILIVQDSEGAVFSYGPTDKPKYIAESLREYLFPNNKDEEERIL